MLFLEIKPKKNVIDFRNKRIFSNDNVCNPEIVNLW